MLTQRFSQISQLWISCEIRIFMFQFHKLRLVNGAVSQSALFGSFVYYHSVFHVITLVISDIFSVSKK